jgi:glycosyltransferase involved in cell wall biosynthesis
VNVTKYGGHVKVALMGTRGVPANYGGFETAVEEIGSRLASRGYEITVYARNPGQSVDEYRGMRVVNIPALRHRMTETLSHTALSAVHAVITDHPDVCLLFNAGNAPMITPLQAAGIPTAVHLDGLESRRGKWRGAGARYYRWAERAAVRRADAVIADSRAIAAHVRAAYGREAVFIPYGAQVIDPGSDRLGDVDVLRRDYHLIVARFEPENHVLDAVHAYRISDETRPLLVVGSAPYSRWYVDRVHEAAQGDGRIRFLGGIYDPELLDQLYANARTYIHGHSVGGTNPSLLRAMGAGAPVLAFDCEFNREVTADNAFFWADAEQLVTLLDDIAGGEDHVFDANIDAELLEFAAAGRRRVAEHYQWDAVTDDYEQLIRDLDAGAQRRKGRRRVSA